MIKDNTTALFAFSSFNDWFKYLNFFAQFRIQRSDTTIRYNKVFKLLQMIAIFECSKYFVALKSVIVQHRMLRSDEIIKICIDVFSHLYKIALWTEHTKMINAIFQRLTRAHLTSIIDEDKDLYVDRSRDAKRQERSAILKAIKAMIVNIYSHMKEWDTFNKFSEVTVFINVQRNLQRWRRKEMIWSLIQRRFDFLTLLILTPHCIRMMRELRSISSCS